MKKPAVSNSKKGILVNILWILIENPLELEYLRIIDIKEILKSEFMIDVDRKTIMDNIDILMDLNLDINIIHEKNKGYKVTSKLLDESEREQVISLIQSQRNLDNNYKRKIIDYLTYDTNYANRKKYFQRNNEYISYDIISNLSIIQKAIDEKKNITFTYSNYDMFGNPHDDLRVYDVYPQYIHYNNGQYYLYCADKVWPTEYCGIRLRYLNNIKIGNKSSELIPINPHIHYKLKVKVNYEWSIEYFPSFFENYHLYTTKEGTYCEIIAPFDVVASWYKLYGFFFTTDDLYLKNSVLNHSTHLLEKLNSSDNVKNKMKGAISTNYFNSKGLNDRATYISKLNDIVLNELFYLGFNQKEVLDNINIARSKDKEVAYVIITEEMFNNIDDLINKLNETNINNRYVIVLFNEMDMNTLNVLSNNVMDKTIVDELDQFSYASEAYYHKHSVLKLK